jgi:hypothetical protein
MCPIAGRLVLRQGGGAFAGDEGGSQRGYLLLIESSD